MSLKQASAAVDSGAVAEDIAGLFLAANMPNLADSSLFLGIPHPVLLDLHGALHKQRSEDEDRKFFNRMRYAGIFKERTENTFCWDADTYPESEPGMVEQVLSIDFVRQGKNLIVVGPPGAGKTLLAVIAACKAIRGGLSVRYRTAHRVATELKEARAGNSLSGYIKKLQSCDLLVMEDITFSSLETKTAQAFFAIVDGRYGRKSTIVTSNGNVKDWVDSFPNKSMCSALLGRLYENALIMNMNGAKDMRISKAGSVFADAGGAPTDGGGAA